MRQPEAFRAHNLEPYVGLSGYCDPQFFKPVETEENLRKLGKEEDKPAKPA
jgi:hypothetical protein